MTGRCIFCRIVAGEAEASIVYRDARVTAFMDLAPVTEGHLLVVPNRHAMYLRDLDPEDGAQLFRIGQQMGAAIRATPAIRSEGINLFLADGVAAGQEVFHVHLHVLPRYEGDGFGLRFPEGYGPPVERSRLDACAAQIRSAR